MTRRSTGRRDPERIDDVLDGIRSAWSADPDLRLAQLVVDAANLAGRDVVAPDLFYLEDDDLSAGLAEYRNCSAAESSNSEERLVRSKRSWPTARLR